MIRLRRTPAALLSFDTILQSMQIKLILPALVACSTLISLACHAQKTDRRLEKKIRTILAGFHGEAGVYVHDLKRNKTVSINADSIFRTASMVKIPILTGIMD